MKICTICDIVHRYFTCPMCQINAELENVRERLKVAQNIIDENEKLLQSRTS